MTKTVYLSHCKCAPHGLARVVGVDVPIAWVLMSQDYSLGIRWERLLGGRFERKSIKHALAAAAAALRRPFLDVLTDLGRKHQSLSWWASRVSERNTAISPLFLYCCYVKIAEDILTETKQGVAIVAESDAVLDSIAQLASDRGFDVRWAYRPSTAKRSIVIRLARVVRFVFRGIRQSYMGADAPALPQGRPAALLHTFLDDSCLRADGYHERYLPGLREWLEKRGISVTYLPVLFNMKRSNGSAWQWLARCGNRFVNPYRYYRFADYAFAIRHAMRACGFEFRPVMVAGVEVGRLFDEAQAENAYGSGTLETLLSYRLPLRLAERGIRFDLVIAEYENMIPEKLLISGFRRYSPKTRLVGFQHGALSPMLLCNFLTRGEAEFAPLPDRIVCNGPFFREILVREGVPSDRAVAGPALRYRHLWRTQVPSDATGRQGIFVPLPLMRSDAVELLAKLVEAFKREPSLHVRLKPHPMSSISGILRDCGGQRMPANFELVGGDIARWFSTACVVIALSSSALFEALAAGVPVVPVGRESSLDLNTLAWYERFQQQFWTPDEIHAETMRLLNLPASDLNAYRAYGRQVLSDSFGPVNDDTMRVFVDGLVDRAAELGAA